MHKLKMFISAGLSLFALVANAQPGAPYQGYTQQPWQAPAAQYNYAPPNQRQSGTPSPMPSAPTYQRPYTGGWPGMQQPGYGQQPPAYGQTPGYGQQPPAYGQAPGYGQQAPAYGQAPGYAQSPYYTTNGKPPRLELSLSGDNPFVQENVLLRLKVISSQNLKTANPEFPQIDNLVFQKIKGPDASSRTHQGTQEIVTTFVYQVTPLRPGRIEIPPIHVTGELENRSGYGRGSSEFDAVSEKRLAINAKPADPTSTPWLPLEQLSLKTRLPDNLRAVAGQPLTLTIEMNAVGASGNQLPNLERYLKSDAFRVYREKSRTTTKLNKKQTKILGRRVDSFTLVPQYGGDLRLPELRIPWWSTKTGMGQHVSVPVQPLAVSGGARGEGMFGLTETTTLFPAGSPAAFWIPLSVVFGVLAGYWLAVWISNRKRKEAPPPAFPMLTQVLKKPFIQMAPAFSPLGDRLRTTTACLNPITRWQKLRRRFIGLMPLSVRFWFCVRCVAEENDPEVWGYTLRFLANKHMDMPPRAPFADIAKRIVDFHPKADPVKIRELAHELDQSIYGHSSLDFEQWKQDFNSEIRPRLKLLPGKQAKKTDVHAGKLPTLNPSVAA